MAGAAAAVDEEAMTPLCKELLRNRLRFIQALNSIAMAMLGGLILVNATYPDVVRSLLAELPPLAKAGALFAFGTAVHLGLRSAKKIAE